MPEDSSDDSLESLFEGSPSSSSGADVSLTWTSPLPETSQGGEDEKHSYALNLTFESFAVLCVAFAWLLQTVFLPASYVLVVIGIVAALVRIVTPQSALLEKALEAASEAAEEPDA